MVDAIFNRTIEARAAMRRTRLALVEILVIHSDQLGAHGIGVSFGPRVLNFSL